MEIAFTLSFNDANPENKQKSKRQKGKSILTIPTDYTIIDLETTGLDTRYDDIIEICCIKYRNNKEISRFSSLVKPTSRFIDDDNNEYFVDEFITKLTGITNEMLDSAPLFKDISKKVWDFLNGEIIVAHNANFDINFLYDNFKNCSSDLIFNNNYVDTLRISRYLLPELKNHKLNTLMEHFGISNNQHRAEADCLNTYEILNKLSSIVTANNINFKDFIKRYDLDLRTLSTTGEKINPEHIFFNKVCVFTGKLANLSRREAAQLVTDIGGRCENSITKRTNFLIIGSFDYVSSVKNNKSSKMKKAEKLILEGQDLQVISENTFYDLISED